jgi:MFS family permease
MAEADATTAKAEVVTNDHGGAGGDLRVEPTYPPVDLPFADRVFPGWWVLAGGITAYLAYSAHFNTAYGVFMYYLGAEMGWSRSALAGVITLARVPEMLCAPWVGAYVDRHGGKRLMLVGAAIVSAAFFLLSTIHEIWQLYLFRGIAQALGALLTGPLVFGVAVNNWFVAKRGRAMGFLRTADTLGTALIPIAIASLIAATNWRVTWMVMGAVALVVLIPAGLVMRRRPEDFGLLPDGAPEAAATRPAEARRRAQRMAADVVWTRRDAIRCPALWAMILSYGLTQMALVAANVHLIPYVQELGYPITVAAALVGSRAYIQLLINPLWGLFLERAPVQIAAAGQAVLGAVAMYTFFAMDSSIALGVGLLLLGIASAGFYLTMDVMWADFFGRVSLGTVRGIAQPIAAIFAATGPLLAGILYDMSGSYHSTWLVLLLALVASASVVLLARRPQPPVHIAPAKL